MPKEVKKKTVFVLLNSIENKIDKPEIKVRVEIKKITELLKNEYCAGKQIFNKLYFASFHFKGHYLKVINTLLEVIDKAKEKKVTPNC